MKFICAICFLITSLEPSGLMAQKYISNSSSVRFFSEAPVENIEATNNGGRSAFDLATGEVVFSIPIKSFTFEKPLMQEHFNENYLESDKYPNALFTGKIHGFEQDTGSWQEATAIGKMTIHGVARDVTYEGKIKIEPNSMEIEAIFPVQLKDYKIKIPKVVFYNIAEIVEVTVKFSYDRDTPGANSGQ